MGIDVCVVSRKGISKDYSERLFNVIPINILRVDKSKPLGKARMYLINKVNSEYFAFIDDDMILPDNWFDYLFQFMNDKVGAIYGLNIIKGLGYNYEKEQIKLFGREVKYLNKCQRGDTNNIIIRTDLVRDWDWLNAPYCYEDYDIINHILNKGYEVLRIPINPINVYHKKTWKGIIRNGIWAGSEWNYYFKKNRFKHIIKAIIHPFKYPFKKMPYMFILQLVMNISFIYGIIKSFFIRRK